jgi:hypothetical protein
MTTTPGLSDIVRRRNSEPDCIAARVRDRICICRTERAWLTTPSRRETSPSPVGLTSFLIGRHADRPEMTEPDLGIALIVSSSPLM